MNDSEKNKFASISDEKETEKARPVVLLHSCCGPCSTAVVEKLMPDYDVELFFYNPNITEEDEYEKRLKAQEEFVEKYNSGGQAKGNLRLIKAEYNPSYFFDIVKGREGDPEGGERCLLCFKMRMEKTAEFASLHGYENFTTTLSVSPYKDYLTISKLGSKLALRYGLNFIADNFKKKDGFHRSIELSKAYDLYRQTYCGCIFSKEESENKR